MYRKIDDFLTVWNHESASTQKTLDALTDASLSTAIAADHRTIARIAWHIMGTIPDMMGQMGVSIGGATEKDPVPTTASAIQDAYGAAAKSVAEQVKSQWKDATLEQEDNLYGETWKRGQTLHALVAHQSHHRGQLTVLMRQAGLKVPGIYGPAKEEWANYNMPAPAV